MPHRFEFWQGQSNRLHDRIVFRKPTPKEMNENSYFSKFAGCKSGWNQGGAMTVTTAQDTPKPTHGDDGWVYERLSP